jgi:uncharacterized protein with ParB-like and HNH nuclease domain/predicted transport protein
MKAKEINLLKFLQGPKQFIIPIYQRTYSWELKQCRQLWSDIIRVAKDPSLSGHFLGSIVYIERSIYQVASVPQLLVIDGQQRLTTITLFLHALGKAVGKSDEDIDITERKLNHYYLFNNEEEDDLRYKLLLTRRDKEMLAALLDDRTLPEDPSPRVIENYRFFEEQIQRSNVNLNTLYEGLQKLIVVDIALDREHDNPQLIFESLNSTGLDLSQADLIRNYVLMGQEPKVQAKLYEEHWFPMEQSFGHDYGRFFDRFMRDYLTVKTGRIPNISEVYNAFKDYTRGSESPEHIAAVLADIYRHARHYVHITLLREPEPALHRAFADLNVLKVEVAYPFLLEAYEDYSGDLIDKDELLYIVRLVESYVFRRAICGIPTNSLNKTFATLMRSMDKERYLESLKVVFYTLGSYRRFPSDAEFKQEFMVKDVYNFRSRNYLLAKLENHGRKEWVNVEEYTIEHVMPQNLNLSQAWQRELGENWKTLQETYLHTLGNLTLTGYNSELSDRPFTNKRDMAGGFKDSPIRLNQSLANLECWNEETIVNRAEQLAEQAIQVWTGLEMSQEVLDQYQLVAPSREGTQYSLESYEYLSGEMLELFEQFRKRVLNLDASVTEVPTKLYIAYKNPTNFVDVVPQKSRLRLSLNLAFDDIHDPRGWCKDVSNVGRWGNGDVEVRLTSPEQLDYVMYLVRQSFERHAELERV